MTSPYSDLPARAYWRSAVAERDALDPGDLYRPRFAIDRKTRIMTAGSCFAQHVGRALRGAGFSVLDTEALPRSLDRTARERFGYGLFSARYGNIYTAAQLLQLLREMRGRVAPAEPVWERDGRFFDAQRPSVEPEGLESPEEVLRHRARHLQAVRRAVKRTDLFVFTFGLTEAWLHSETGTVYPTAPGTVAGRFDPATYAFHNYQTEEVLRDFLKVRRIFKTYNPDCRFLVTVSPVPLTATASGQHVEVATAYSKAVLRAACGSLLARAEDVDYFPSYEIITSLNNRGAYFRSNKRSVSPKGVETAMSLFLAAHGAGMPQERGDDPGGAAPRPAPAGGDDDVQCEDALLEAFAR